MNNKHIIAPFQTEDFDLDLLVKPTGKRPLGSSRRRWEDNIRMDLEEIYINAGNWVDSTQGRRALVNAALNLRVPQVMELLDRMNKRLTENNMIWGSLGNNGKKRIERWSLGRKD